MLALLCLPVPATLIQGAPAETNATLPIVNLGAYAHQATFNVNSPP